MQYFRQALTLLRANEKRQIVWLLGLSTVAAVAQTMAIISIMPFIILLSNPAARQSNPILTQLDQSIATDSPHQLLLWLGVIGIFALAIGNLFIALENWLIQRYLSRLEHRIENDLMRKMLSRPFEYFAEHHSGRLSNILLDQVDRVVGGVVGAFFGIVTNCVLALLIVMMLLLISFKTTVITLIALFVLYFTVYLLLKRRIARHGEELTQLSGDIHTAVKETLGGIREIKMNHAEGFFSRRFERSSLPLSKLVVRSSVLEFLPNFILETLLFAGLVGVGLFFVIFTDSAGMSLSFIALYGIATYRLVPALNGVFQGLSQMQHDGDAVTIVIQHFARPLEDSPSNVMQSESRDLRVNNVTFRYPDSETDQLVGVNLDIPAGSSICFFGESGAGKSTLLNLLAGLVLPKSGVVLCGDASSGDVSLDSWRKNVSLCAQQIFIFDGTIASNIAFGQEPHEVNQDRVRRAAKLAMLGRYVDEEAAAGVDSIVGEGGGALSGGQRQRLGIARALYKNADILIFDESLVGLDESNQSAILDNLFALSGKTLILSTHDRAVAKRCDKVVLLHGGRLVASGKYEDVIPASN